MKNLMIILFTLCIAIESSAQHYGRVYVHPRVIIGVGAYSPYYGYGYYPWGVPPMGYYYGPRVTRLEAKIQNIRAEYKDRIWSARRDKTISRAQRKQEIRELKHERNEAIIEVKRNYYKTRPIY